MDLDGRQVSVLIGSLLGDGSVFQGGSRTARFTESHAVGRDLCLHVADSDFGGHVTGVAAEASDVRLEGNQIVFDLSLDNQKERRQSTLTIRFYVEQLILTVGGLSASHLVLKGSDLRNESLFLLASRIAAVFKKLGWPEGEAE